MSDVISDYQRWKLRGENLRAKAKDAMESWFRDLLSEAMRIAEEYHADFGGTPTKNLEDQVYEIEDDLRLAGGAR